MNEIDRVMMMSPEDLLGAQQDIDILIAYYRKDRAAYESGGKRPKKGPAVEVSLADIGLDLIPKGPLAAGVKRRRSL